MKPEREKLELKANIIATLLNRAFVLFSGTQFKGIVDRFVRKNYAKGMNAEEVKLKMRTNAIPEERKIDLMTQQTSSEISGVMEDLSRTLQESIREGVLNNENPTQLKKRVQLLLNPTEKRKYDFASGRKMNWSDRINMITRTESNRAQNHGRMDTFKQSGLEGRKYLDVHEDERTSKICGKMNTKYTRDKAIPLDEEFEVVVPKLGVIRGQMPPFHPNCRTRLMLKVGDDE